MTAWPYIHNENVKNIVRSDGCYLYQDDGKRLLDACGGAIVTNIGHGRHEVADVVAKSTLNTGYVIPPWLTPEREALVERLTRDWLPPDMSHIHTTCGGSEGNEAAMKIAVQYHAAQGKTEKCKIVGRNVSYHGTTITTLAVGGHESRKTGLKHALQIHPSVEAPYLLRCEASDPTAHYVQQFIDGVEKEDPATVAALIAEPITGASGGALVPPDGYWDQVSAYCREHDILIISDEVMTGYGRTGTRFGYQHWDFEPDILVGGKGLAGGYAPITAVASKDRVAEHLASAGFDVMFHTFSAHPAACAAADKVLQILDEEDLVAQVKPKGEVLTTQLHGAFSNHPHVAEIRGKGLLQAIELVENRDTLKSYDAKQRISGKVANLALEKGVCFYPGGNGIVQDVLVIGPPYTINEDQISEIVHKLSEAVDEVTLN
ncbi:MAG: aminotransferase class III-fold pyridoxal phosphate-dependent enzyme [Gammaproteobacteria bacterium]|nr:aminotransferase class III-fold pyridoxal phosphate-dependent enzyme [Gammaproteobacteria bacterium]